MPTREDTLMCVINYLVAKRRREAQAEISFKLGRREVVEWIREHATFVIAEKDKILLKHLEGCKPNALLLSNDDWQVQLQEWGIK